MLFDRPSFASAKWLVLAGIIFYFFIHLGAINDYGASYDETSGMKRGESVAVYVGKLWESGEIEAMPAEKVHFHPTFYPVLNYASFRLWNGCFGMERIASRHLLNLASFCLGLVILYFLARSMFNERAGLFAVLLLAFYPRLVAHAHYNGKDIPVMTLALGVISLLYHGARTLCLRRALYAGAVFGAAAGTKLDALFLPLIFGSAAAAAVAFRKGPVNAANVRRAGQFAAVFLGSSVLFTYALWPILWHDPWFLIRSAYRFSRPFEEFTIPYLGKWQPNDQVPWHYTVVHLAAVTPLPVLIAFVFGAFATIKLLARKEKTFECALLWAWILIPLLARMRPGTPQYDGIRHVFIILPAASLIGALGIDRMGAMLPPRGAKRVAAKLAAAAAGIGVIFQIWTAHPYQGSYVNEAAQLVLKERLGDYFDVYSWGTVMRDAVIWLNQYAPPNASVAAAGDKQMLEEYQLRSDLAIVPPENADLLIVPGWKRTFTPLSSPCFALYRYQTPLLWIYPRVE